MATSKINCYGKMSMNCVPEDVWKFILKKQLEFKLSRPTHSVLSLQETVCRIIKEHKDF